MAEIIYGTVSSILFTLGSQAFQDLRSNFKVSKELENLQATLDTIKASLLDAGQVAESSNLVKNCISRLEDVVYDADDLLDEFQYKQLRQKVHRKRRSRVRIHLSCLNPLSSRSKMAHRVKEIKERLDKVAEDFSKFNLVKTVKIDTGVPDQRKIEMGVVNSWRETDSSVKSEIIGRNQNREDIINLLKEPATSGEVNFSVVGIVGIGGLGKTALARLVYNEPSIKNHFSLKIWVCVSEEFEIKLLIKKILKSRKEGRGDKLDLEQLDLEQLQIQLREVLRGKRYLIVLDDVWNDDNLKWYNFSEYLLCGAPGSKILVTTRNRSVAVAMGIKFPYVLDGLDSAQSWDLFKHVVTLRGQNEIDIKLELIGKEVVERCKGVPLAIKTLASSMRQNPNEHFWLSIKENHEVWKSVDSEEGIFPVLKLSYNHLPSHLRPCFAFCSIFTKDYIIRKHKLIQLWNAQGYIQPSNRNQRSVDLGDQYYNDLLSRSFLQEEMEDREGNITCKMHDLIHDLAQLVAGSSFYPVKDNNQTIPKKVRHVFLECNPSQNFEIKGIRTILRSDNDKSKYMGREVFQIPRFSNLICSRVLVFNYVDIKMLPNEIGKLKHLRSLDLSGTCIKVLPDSITNLHNLQTLLLENCLRLKRLPKDISKLISLECLSIKGCEKGRYQKFVFGLGELTSLPKGLGELTSLQRLSNFIVNIDEKKFSSSATLNELRDLNYLGGDLEIINLDMVRNVELESNEANLREKKHLKSLKLSWGGFSEDRKNDELLMDNLEPHPNLKELKIDGYRGTRFSRWLSSLENLVHLHIRDSTRCQQLPRLDQFPLLEFLGLERFDALEYVADEEDPSSSLSCSTSTTATMFFPSLKKLYLGHCENLKGWWRRKNKNEGSPSELPCFPCLSSLKIYKCPNLTSMPLFPYLEDLQLDGTSMRLLQQTLIMKTNNTSTESASSASSSSSRSPSTAPPLSNLKRLTIDTIHDVTLTLPEEFLLNLTSLEHLTLTRASFYTTGYSLHTTQQKKTKSTSLNDKFNLHTTNKFPLQRFLPDDYSHGIKSIHGINQVENKPPLIQVSIHGPAHPEINIFPYLSPP